MIAPRSGLDGQGEAQLSPTAFPAPDRMAKVRGLNSFTVEGLDPKVCLSLFSIPRSQAPRKEFGPLSPEVGTQETQKVTLSKNQAESRSFLILPLCPMTTPPHLDRSTDDIKRKLLNRIVLGAAWADGKLEAAEVDYLKKILLEQEIAEDEEIQALLQAPPSAYQLELWMVQYLGCTDVPERLGALAQIANLLMSDGEVSTVEHDFLDEIHTLMSQIPPQPHNVQTKGTENILSSLGKIVRQFLNKVE